MVAQVKAWGNSQGIRLSKELLDSLGIYLNEYLDVKVVNGDIVLSKTFRHKTLEERAAEYGGKPGPYEEMSWGEPGGREMW
ncbi:MAG: AbrB/MazE/SpoVT family DNA-binding domain-containing protein [Lachnospiraceae bacterium]|nr:AbrB/MazE/SpoVT family DNA-binding domain-containing protein [Lachnospiraceae bacterium]